MASDNYKDINFKDHDRISSRKKVDEQNSMYDTFMDFEKDRTIDNELLRLSNQEEPKKLRGIKGFFKNSLNKLKKKKKNEMTPRKGSFDSGAPRTPNLESSRGTPRQGDTEIGADGMARRQPLR